jgi:hypothetical protein
MPGIDPYTYKEAPAELSSEIMELGLSAIEGAISGALGDAFAASASGGGGGQRAVGGADSGGWGGGAVLVAAVSSIKGEMASRGRSLPLFW